MERNLLVLDIDETLILAAESPLLRPEDFRVASYWVYCRPYLSEFLEFVLAAFDVAIWTSAGADYAASIVDRIIPRPERLRFVWASEHCTRRFDHETHKHYWIKKLSKLKQAGYNLERVLVIDDSPEKHHMNYGNLIRVAPFTGESNDTELRDLLPYLNSLRAAENIRSIEKRNWRTVARPSVQQVSNKIHSPTGKKPAS